MGKGGSCPARLWCPLGVDVIPHHKDLEPHPLKKADHNAANSPWIFQCSLNLCGSLSALSELALESLKRKTKWGTHCEGS
jgi:hypothetical protein